MPPSSQAATGQDSEPLLTSSTAQPSPASSVRSPSKRKTSVAPVASSGVLGPVAPEDDNDHAEFDDDGEYDRRSTDSSASSTSVVFDNIDSATNSLRVANFSRPTSTGLGTPPLQHPSATSVFGAFPVQGLSTGSPGAVSSISPSLRSGASTISLSSSNASRIGSMAPQSLANPITAATAKLRGKSTSGASGMPASAESERLLLSAMNPDGYRDDDDGDEGDDAAAGTVDIERAVSATEPAAALNNGAAGAAVQSLNVSGATLGVDDEDEDDVPVPSSDEVRKKRLTKKIFVGVLGGLTVLWVIGLIFYLVTSMRRGGTSVPPDDKIYSAMKLDDVLGGTFRAKRVSIDWLDDGIAGHDGLYAEHDASGKLLIGDYSGATISEPKTLIDSRSFKYEGSDYIISNAWPGKGLEQVLLLTNPKKVSLN